MAGDQETPSAQPAVTQQRPPSPNGQRPRPPGPNDVQPTAASKDQSNNRFSNMRPRPWWITFVIVLVVNYLLVQFFLPEQTPQRVDVPYTFFKAQVTADNVTEVTSRADVIQGTFRTPVLYPPDRQDGKTSPQFQTV